MGHNSIICKRKTVKQCKATWTFLLTTPNSKDFGMSSIAWILVNTALVNAVVEERLRVSTLNNMED